MGFSRWNGFLDSRGYCLAERMGRLICGVADFFPLVRGDGSRYCRILYTVVVIETRWPGSEWSEIMPTGSGGR